MQRIKSLIMLVFVLALLSSCQKRTAIKVRDIRTNEVKIIYCDPEILKFFEEGDSIRYNVSFVSNDGLNKAVILKK